MKKKLLSMLTAAALLISALPQSISYAEEQYPKIKFGFATGDIINFGSGESVTNDVTFTAPQKFLVLDSEKTSTGDTDGVFMITKDAAHENAMKLYDFPGTSKTQSDYFLNLFTEDEQELIISTSKTSSTTIDGFVVDDSLNEQKIFSLSKKEAAAYLDMLKLNPGKDWMLRSGRNTVDTYYGTPDTYYKNSYVSANNAISESLPMSKLIGWQSVYFRPGMNISESKAAIGTPFGDRILLLPSAAEDTQKLVSVYSDTEQEYSLPVKDSGITEISSETKSINGNGYTFSVAAPRADESAADSEYITFLVTDINSENISYFGRFKKTGSTTEISLNLPDSLNADNCKMYVFNEIYTGGKGSKISSLASVCLKHDYSYSDNADGTHTLKCKNCGNTKSENHDLTYTKADGDKHTEVCGKCTYTAETAHQFGEYIKKDDNHYRICDLCGYQTEKSPHENTFKSLGERNHEQTCAICGYTTKMTHGIEWVEIADNDNLHIRKCKLCDYSLNERHSYDQYTDDGDGWHKIICSDCGHFYKQPHCYSSSAEKVDSKQHRRYCTECTASELVDHSFEYINNKDGTHKSKCTVCGYEINKKHSYIYKSNSDGSYYLFCSDCGSLYIKANAEDISGDFSERLGAIDFTNVICSMGTVVDNNAAFNLFNKDSGFFRGSGKWTANGYALAADFAFKRPISLTGFKVGVGDNVSAAEVPQYIILSGRNDGDTDYTPVAAVPADGMITDANNGIYTFYFCDDTDAYKYYRVALVRENSGNIRMGSFVPLSEKGTAAKFDLSGVYVTDGNDLLVPGEDYECTLVSQKGHPAEAAVIFDSADFTDFTYSPESGILHIDGDKIKYGTYKISASAQVESVNVTKDLHRVSFSGADSAKFGEDYSGYFLDNDGKTDKIPGADNINVFIGTEEFTGFTYDITGGYLKIPGKYITGDITVKAAEKGSVKKENSIASVTADGDIPRYYSAISDIEAAAKNSDVKINLLGNLSGELTFGRTVGRFDFGGFTLNGYADLKNSSLTFENGSLISGGINTGMRISGSDITLGKDFSLTSNKSVGLDTDNSTIVVDGAKISGKTYAIYMSYDNTLIVKSGEFDGNVKGRSNSKIELYGGTFTALAEDEFNSIDFAEIIGEGYAYKFQTAGKTIDEVFESRMLENFSVEKSPYAYAKENKQVDFGYSDSIKLESGAAAQSYQWYRNGELISGAASSSYTVETGLMPGEYQYTCIASDGTYYAPVKRIGLTVYCSHEILDEKGKCQNCSTVFNAAVTNKNGQTFLAKTISEAINSVEPGGEIKLLTDIDVSETIKADDDLINYIELDKKDITLDLNNKSITNSTENIYVLYITDAAAIKNGTVGINIDIYYDAKNVILENLKVTGTTAIYSQDVNIVSGEYHNISGRYHLAGYLSDKTTLKSGSTWIDVDNSNECTDVKVVPAPVYFTKMPKSVHLENAGYSDGGVLSVETEKSAGYESEEITYQWYACSDASGNFAAVEGETGSTVKIPTGIKENNAVFYMCKITCGEYSRNSAEAAVLVGSVFTPEIYISDDGDVGVSGYYYYTGDIVIAGYDNNDRMTDAVLVKLTMKNDNMYSANIYDDLNFGNKNKTVKVFLFDNINNMIPLCKNESKQLK